MLKCAGSAADILTILAFTDDTGACSYTCTEEEMYVVTYGSQCSSYMIYKSPLWDLVLSGAIREKHLQEMGIARIKEVADPYTNVVAGDLNSYDVGSVINIQLTNNSGGGNLSQGTTLKAG